MAKEVQRRGGSTAQHLAFTGADREITVDTTKKTLVVHDGVTPGGVPLAKESQLLNPASVLPRTIEMVNIAYSATINIDFAENAGKVLVVDTLTGDLTFTFSNIAQGRKVSVDLLCGSTQRSLTFPGSTPFYGPKPSNIAASKAARVAFECVRGTTEAGVRAAYGVQS